MSISSIDFYVYNLEKGTEESVVNSDSFCDTRKLEKFASAPVIRLWPDLSRIFLKTQVIFD